MSHHRHCTSHKSWSTVYNYGLCPFFFFLLRVVWPLHILQKMTKCTISTFVPKYSFYLHFCSKILILWHFIPMFSETHHQNCSALSPRNLLQNHLDRGKKKKEKTSWISSIGRFRQGCQHPRLLPGITLVPWLLLLPVCTFFTVKGSDSDFANFTLPNFRGP